MVDEITNNAGETRLVSVVVPCYNSEQTIGELVELTIEKFAELPGYSCEFVLVNDCSKDRTFEVIKELGKKYSFVHGVNLMKNFGQANALMCAMSFSQGDIILGMDDDLQTHPNEIPKILDRLEEGYDLVYGVYPESKNGTAKNFSSWLNKTTARVLLERPKDIRSSNFWACTRQLRDQVVQYKNYNPMLDALFTRMTTNIGNVDIEHHKRARGTSNYTLRKLIKLWLAYFNYTVIPLRIVSGAGVLTAIIGFLIGLVTAIRKILNPAIPAGWTSLLCVMLLFFGLVLLGLGIIGEYLGDIVLTINSSPQYIVRDKVNL